MNCPICNGTLLKQTKEIKYEYKKYIFKINQIGDYCQVCGEGFLSPYELKDSKNQIQDFKLKLI